MAAEQAEEPQIEEVELEDEQPRRRKRLLCYDMYTVVLLTTITVVFLVLATALIWFLKKESNK
jgi:flagellar basal body-associated protein FliL